MTRELFIRDKVATEAALFKSYAEFSIIFERFDNTHDLKAIYDSIRKDCISKDKTLSDKIYRDLKNTEETAKKTESSIKKPEFPKDKVEKGQSAVDLSKGSKVDEKTLFNDILNFFKTDEKLTPKASHELIEEKYSSKFDAALIKKIHYKVYNKHIKNK